MEDAEPAARERWEPDGDTLDLGSLDPGASADGTAEVTGKVLFFANGSDLSTSEDNGKWLGINSAKVHVYDDSGTVLDRECTDSTGGFTSDSFSTSDEWGTPDVYIKVTPQCSGGVDLIDGDEVQVTWTSKDDSDKGSCKSGINWDIGTGTFDIGECEGPEWQHDLWTIRDYAKTAHDEPLERGYDPGGVTVKVPAGHGSEYHSGNDTIHIESQDYVDAPDTASHEVGHFVMDAVYDGLPNRPNCDPHDYGVRTSQGCAWVEGWAEYFAVQAFRGEPRWRDDSGTDDGIVEDYDLEDNPDLAGLVDPYDDVEGTVAGSLWDLHDNMWDDTNSDWVTGYVNSWEWHDIFEVFEDNGDFDPADKFTDYRDWWEGQKSRRDFRRTACDNYLDEYDGSTGSASVNSPDSAGSGEVYTVAWTSSDGECGVQEVDLQENPPTEDTWTTVCEGGLGESDGSCTLSHTLVGEYCYRADVEDAAGNDWFSSNDCTSVQLGDTT